MSKSKSKTALIDADICLWKAAYLNDGDEHTLLENFWGMCKQWMNLAGCEAFIPFMTPPGKTGFRYTIFPEYKSHRPDDKPEYFELVRDEVINDDRVHKNALLEADDLIGIMHTESPSTTVMVTIDKDFLGIPGTLYNPDKDSLLVQNRRNADWWFHLQWMVGDTSDGFKGIPQVGPKKAEKYLSGCTTEGQMSKAVLDAYAERGYSYWYALQQGMMARILRTSDYIPGYKCGIPSRWRPKPTGKLYSDALF